MARCQFSALFRRLVFNPFYQVDLYLFKQRNQNRMFKHSVAHHSQNKVAGPCAVTDS